MEGNWFEGGEWFGLGFGFGSVPLLDVARFWFGKCFELSEGEGGGTLRIVKRKIDRQSVWIQSMGRYSTTCIC